MRPTSRRGAALAVALFALVITAALANGIITAAVAHRRAAVRAAAYQSAESLAEAAVAGVVATWPPTRWRELEVGHPWERTASASSDGPRAPAAASSTRTRVLRLDERLFLLAVEASVTALDAPVAARRSLFVELRTDSVRLGPALTSGGAVILGTVDEVSRDTTCAAAEEAGLVMLPPGTPLDWPRLGVDSLVVRDTMAGRQATYDVPAGIDVARLLAAPDVELAPGASLLPQPESSGTSCGEGISNWGEPLRDAPGAVHPCAGRFPIVHVGGDLRVVGGRGQGILVVDGRLEIVGPFVYRGIILAAGGIDAHGGETTIVGAILTGPAAGATFRSDRTRLVASRCAAQSALDAAAGIAPLPGWAWGR